MKKLLLLMIGAVGMLSAQTQQTKESPIKKNNYYVGLSSNQLTGLSYTGDNELKSGVFNVGMESGYMVTDRLSVLGGVGYTHSYVKDVYSKNTFNYLVGARLYFGGLIPIQVDYNGNDQGTRNVGTSLGYNWVVARHLTLEPNVRYNIDTRYGNNVWSGGLRINYWVK